MYLHYFGFVGHAKKFKVAVAPPPAQQPADAPASVEQILSDAKLLRTPGLFKLPGPSGGIFFLVAAVERPSGTPKDPSKPPPYKLWLVSKDPSDEVRFYSMHVIFL